MGHCWSEFLYFPFNANDWRLWRCRWWRLIGFILVAAAVCNQSQCLCEHVAHCRQELHATISFVVVSRYIRLDSFFVYLFAQIALFLRTTNLEAVSVLFLLLMCIYPLTPRPTNLHIQLPRFPLPRFQRPAANKQEAQLSPRKCASAVGLHCTLHWRSLEMTTFCIERMRLPINAQ